MFGRSYQVQQTKNQDGWASVSKVGANLLKTCENNGPQKESLQDEGNDQFYRVSGRGEGTQNAIFQDNEMHAKMNLLKDIPFTLL
jgi:hypothetical protein